MKRCPECLFIYPDSDTRCDFDSTPLVIVDDAELDAATTQPKTPSRRKRGSTNKKPASTKPNRTTKKRKATALTAIIGLLLGLSAFLIYYYRSTHRTENVAQLPPTPIASAQPIVASIPSPSPLTTASPTPTATQIPISKPATDRIATAHTTTTVAPISTSGPGMIKNGKAIILLTNGSKLSADEVWRTRDGVWYRRDGIVTLLKRGQVKAIIN